jgi:cyclase
MKKKRIIPIVLLKDGFIVQSFNFKEYKKLGNPSTIIERLSSWMSDEIIYLNISKKNNFSLDREDLNYQSKFSSYREIIEYTSKKTLCPVTFGGSIKSLAQIESYLRSGADKISINTHAIENKKFIYEAAKEFGSQCIIVSIDYIKVKKKYKVVYKGSKILDIDLINWAKECVNQGCGEILLNSVENDGLKNGFDYNAIKLLTNKINIPIIACGGASCPNDFYQMFKKTKIEALAAANLFHHIEHGDYIIKKELFNKVKNIRAPSFFDKNKLRNQS